jgi:hypothetical protein
VRVYYDTEFIDDGLTIQLLSIGMIREDGKTYYAVVNDLDLMLEAAYTSTNGEYWLRNNVLNSLPVTLQLENRVMPVDWNSGHPDFENIKTQYEIHAEVRKFLADTSNLELWAWYAAYDHVALAQIFGRMLNLPEDVPMWTNDLRQELHRLGNPRYPEQASGAHNALEDARWNRVLGDYLQKLDGPIERR